MGLSRQFDGTRCVQFTTPGMLLESILCVLVLKNNSKRGEKNRVREGVPPCTKGRGIFQKESVTGVWRETSSKTAIGRGGPCISKVALEEV